MATPSPTPALPPPPGQTSNFENPDSLAPRNNVAISIAIPLITILFILRVYSRVGIQKTWTIEDWFALASWAGTVAFAGVGIGTMEHFGGKHIWDITAAQAVEAAYWFNLGSIVYGVTICFAKLAVLWLYRRIFSPTRRSPLDLSILFLVGVNALFYTATTFVKIWQCTPREKIFNPRVPGSCVDVGMLFNVSGMFNTVMDLIVVFLPVRAVWNMNIKLTRKIMVILIFTFGLCAPAFSLAGFLARLRSSTDPDKGWVQHEIILWALAELSTGVLCVSLPELGRVVRKRRRPGPTDSVVQGKYHDYGQRSRGISTVISNRKMDNDPYMELEESDTYQVRSAAHGSIDADSKPPEGLGIAITQEFRVDSRSLSRES